MTHPAAPPTSAPSDPPRPGESGVVLLLVVMILAGLVALALPLALMSHDYELSSEATADDGSALRFAETALNSVKERLRRGTWDREMEAAGLAPLPSPTPTPSNPPDYEPYNTPTVDGTAETYIGRDSFWREMLGDGVQRPDGVIVGVEVEDEQGKLNLNSMTPEILTALYLVVTGRDPADFDDSERADFEDFSEKLLAELALLRAKEDGSTPNRIESLSELRATVDDGNGGRLGLTDNEFELLAKYLTVYSWRTVKSGFAPGYDFLRELDDESRSQGYITGSGIALPAWGASLVRLEYLDERRRPLGAPRYVLLERGETPEGEVEYRLPLDEIPAEAKSVGWRYEEFHPVNVNTCAREVLAALIEAGIDLDSPQWTFDELFEAVNLIMPAAEIVRAEKTDDGVALYPSDEAVLDYFGARRFFCSFGDRYFFAIVDGDHILADELAEGEDELLLDVELPAAARKTLLSPGQATQAVNGISNSALKNRIREVAGSVLSVVSWDVYTLRAWASVNAESMMERARAGVREVVKLGLGRSYFMETLPDRFIPQEWDHDVFPRYREYSKVRLAASNWTTGKLDWTDPGEDEPLSADEAEGCYLPRHPSPPAFSGDDFTVVRAGTTPFHVLSDTSITLGDPSSFFKDYLGKGNAGGFALNGSLAVSMWLKAMGWEPWNSSGKRRLFRLAPPDAYSAAGNIELYMEDGKLTLDVRDDTGNYGRLEYALTRSNFPAGVWMHVGFQVCGNREGQMALFVDGRSVEAEWSGSTDEGWFHRLAGSWPCRTPALALPFDKGLSTLTVDSTEGFPDSGYLRVEDEVVYYASKTPTAFNGVRRAVGGTEEADHAAGEKVLPAVALSGSPPPEEIPRNGDEVTLLSYRRVAEPSRTYYVRRERRETFTLDMDAAFDTERDVWVLCAPKGVSFSGTEALAGDGNDRLYVLRGVSGTLPTGEADTGKISAVFFSQPGLSGEGFSGLAAQVFLTRSYIDPVRLPADLDEDTTEIPRSYVSYPLSDGDAGLCKIDDEIVGFRVDGDTVRLTRGMLSSQKAEHVSGSWVSYLSLFPAAPLKEDLSAEAETYTGSMNGYYPWYRVDDEIICFSHIGDSDDGPVFELIRGCYGSEKKPHEAGALAVAFYVPAQLQYDMDDGDKAGVSYLGFRVHRDLQRCVSAEWRVWGADKDYVGSYLWVQTQYGAGSFSASGGGPQMFVLGGDGEGGSGLILRNGKPVLTDEAEIRLAFAFNAGAWLPDDPTRHAWKSFPRVRVWLRFEDADKVYEHAEEK